MGLLSDDTLSKLFQLLKSDAIPDPSELRTQIALGLFPCLPFFFHELGSGLGAVFL